MEEGNPEELLQDQALQVGGKDQALQVEDKALQVGGKDQVLQVGDKALQVEDKALQVGGKDQALQVQMVDMACTLVGGSQEHQVVGLPSSCKIPWNDKLG